MIHKQQMGHTLPDIVAGLCEAMVRNYLNNVGKGKEIEPPIVFQGGVAANQGMRAAFEKALQAEIVVPRWYGVAGAYGAALLARDQAQGQAGTRFRGWEVSALPFQQRSFECKACPNACEVIENQAGPGGPGQVGDRCGRWDETRTRPEAGEMIQMRP